MALIIGPVTATCASSRVIALAWRTTRAPILIRLRCKLVSDQSAIASGRSMQRRKVAKLQANPFPPEPHGLMADLDAALVQQVLNVTQRHGVRT